MTDEAGPAARGGHWLLLALATGYLLTVSGYCWQARCSGRPAPSWPPWRTP